MNFEIACFTCNPLKNRFYVAMCLYSNQSHMMLKCGKNKKVAYEAETSESLIKCFYHILTSSVTYYLSTDPQQLGMFLFEI